MEVCLFGPDPLKSHSPTTLAIGRGNPMGRRWKTRNKNSAVITRNDGKTRGRALISYHHHLGFFPRSLGGRFLIYNAQVRLGGASLSQASWWVAREDGLPTLDRTGAAWGGGFSCLGALGQGSLNSLCWRPADPLPILRSKPTAASSQPPEIRG